MSIKEELNKLNKLNELERRESWVYVSPCCYVTIYKNNDDLYTINYLSLNGELMYVTYGNEDNVRDLLAAIT